MRRGLASSRRGGGAPPLLSPPPPPGGGLIGAVPESSDGLLERYLGGEPIEADALAEELAAAVRAGAAYPVLPVWPLGGAAGPAPLDALVDLAGGPPGRGYALGGGGAA